MWILALVIATPHSTPVAPDSVPLYDNLGSHHFPITTRVPLAQRYFDQGIRLTYGFNHEEAIGAFEESARLDPNCAMCYWGAALAHGPNINATMDSAAGVAAYQAILRARRLAGRASPRERAYINALARRYAPVPASDRSRLDSAYARAMAEVARRHPDDPDAATLYADALMNLSPWNYWTDHLDPRPQTPELLAQLQRAMAANPDHPGACHLYIHAVEAAYPERAVACAERLAALMPGAGHLVHMPGHIYIRVGRYLDAIEANMHAVHADETYLEGPYASRAGLYALGYYPHNYHFMNFAAAMAGRSATAIHAARKAMATLGLEVVREYEWLEALTPVVYWTLTTFGRWDEVLAEPLPPDELRFARGMAFYARGVALAATARFDDARAALDTVRAAADAWPAGDLKTALEIATHLLLGEIAERSGDPEQAVSHFTAAVGLESGLAYNEPPTWYYPVRHSLGRALLAARRPAEAEAVYREDLRRFPENGWSLFGLLESLRAQGKAAEAREVDARLRKAWEGADVMLTASRF